MSKRIEWIAQSALVLAFACGESSTNDDPAPPKGHGQHEATKLDAAVAHEIADAAVDGAAAALSDATVAATVAATVDAARDAAAERDASSAFDADAQFLFDYPHVPTFDFRLPEADWLHLQQTAQEEQFVEAQCSFEGQDVGVVGLRFKGFYGSLYGCFDEEGKLICPRLSLKVKFNEYVEGQRFYGLKRLNFNAYLHDDSRMKERLGYDLFRQMGIVAPRAAWAVVRVNGESLGLYGMVEQIDGRLTKDRWPDAPNGNLFKEVWPGETGSSALRTTLATNEEAADVSAFLAFSEALNGAAEEDALPTLGGFMDLDYLARYMAVDDAIANYDGVTYFWTDGVSSNNHNFFVYQQAPAHFVLVPWDVEASFWINPDHAAPHWTELQQDCTQTYPYWEGLALAPACDIVFHALSQDVDAWRQASRELLDGPFAEDKMRAQIERHAAFIADAAHADPTPNKYVTFDAAVAILRNTIADLRTRLEALIATP